MNIRIEYEGVCYVLLQTGKIHPIAYERHNLIWYPERAMTLLDCVQYQPYIKSVVTENCWIITCYPRESVRVWDKKYGWILPDYQTYGASVNQINACILGIRQTMASAPYDGGIAIKKLIKELNS